jgi:hypothetical protein
MGVSDHLPSLALLINNILYAVYVTIQQGFGRILLHSSLAVPEHSQISTTQNSSKQPPAVNMPYVSYIPRRWHVYKYAQRFIPRKRHNVAIVRLS